MEIFGIFPIVPKGKGGFRMEVGNARKWQAFFVEHLKINLWVSRFPFSDS